MQINYTPLSGLVVVEPKVYSDSRGYFFESFRKDFFDTLALPPFVQDNQSKSNKGTLRGLHFQTHPHAQGKLVRVISGSALDIAVDIRNDSPTYGQWFSLLLDTVNHAMMYIPPGFAHGFETLEDNTVFAYKCTDYYHPECEGCIAWNDPNLNIQWRLDEHLLSEKDNHGTPFLDFVSPF
ncbi:MAG: dTDP-4-dehydrorhamnose 3,5-epimerase [Bacteroidia bacterium]|nr:dTDP-4-dehydrorhamnose 3,5-epimerase [Bacteroidia bacterium]